MTGASPPEPELTLTEHQILLPSWSASYLAAAPRADAEATPEVVLCLHGFPDIPRGWSQLMHALASRGYRAVAPWLRGYAPSSLAGPYDMERLADDVLELAERLSPGRPVSLVGHDFGALITYSAIARRPERFRRAVTLAVPHPLAFLRRARLSQLRRSWYMLLFQARGLSERVVTRRNYAFIEQLWRAWSPSLPLDRAHLAEVKACLTRSLPAPLGYYRALPRSALMSRRVRAELRALKVPLLYLQGREDGCIGWQLMEGQARYFEAGYQGQLVDGAGHFLHLERPEVVSASVLSWLAV